VPAPYVEEDAMNVGEKNLSELNKVATAMVAPGRGALLAGVSFEPLWVRFTDNMYIFVP
jgi:hypothetical protein